MAIKLSLIKVGKMDSRPNGATSLVLALFGKRKAQDQEFLNIYLLPGIIKLANIPMKFETPMRMCASGNLN